MNDKNVSEIEAYLNSQYFRKEMGPHPTNKFLPLNQIVFDEIEEAGEFNVFNGLFQRYNYSDSSRGKVHFTRFILFYFKEKQRVMQETESCLPSKSKKGKKMDTLTERRAIFVYEGARLAAIAAKAPIVPISWEGREQDFRDQFLQVIERQCGDQRSCSPEELHGSWMQSYISMGWVYGEEYDREKRIHPDLVPYAQLGDLERDKDAVFVTLCDIARQWVK